MIRVGPFTAATKVPTALTEALTKLPAISVVLLHGMEDSTVAAARVRRVPMAMVLRAVRVLTLALPVRACLMPVVAALPQGVLVVLAAAGRVVIGLELLAVAMELLDR